MDTQAILDKYEITAEEFKKAKRSLFESMEPLRMKVFSAREKKKVISLILISECFDTGKTYTESDVNGILKPIYEDFSTIRRALIDYGFLTRSRDGREYHKIN